MLGSRRGWIQIAGMLAIVVPATLISPISAQAIDDPGWHKAQEQHAVPGHAVKARGPLTDPGAAYDLKGAPSVAWPAPGTAVVKLPAPADGMSSGAANETTPDAARRATPDATVTGPGGAGKVRAGELPIRLGPATTASRGNGRAPAAEGPAGALPAVQVRTLDARTAGRSQINGLGIRLTPQTPPSASARLAVEVDYSGFRYAFGGDWGSRLRLVRLPGCAATTPERAECQTRTPLPTQVNDVKTGRLAADVDLVAGATTLAAEAAPSGSAGSYEATSLSPSATWSVSNQSGAFSWSYPLRLPPTPGGPTPNIGFAYSSGSIDGRTVATNNQASWIGEGFDYWPGFIERRYKQCADDGVTPKRSDQCWGNFNATLSLNGQATELVLDDATHTWQPKEDDGSKVERLSGADNGDDDGEYWRVTTPDGTQYYFGRNRLPGWVSGKAETQSTWTVPVFGDDDGEPCHQDSFADSWCQQAWRWNLDYVVDPHGTVSTFWYGQESNYYRRNVTTLTDGVPNGTPTAYDRSGYLKRIDYGQRSDAIFSSSAPARVAFDVKERCIPTSGFDCAESKFTKDNAKYWPDVPYDQNCDSGEKCIDKYSPTFWTRKRLAAVTTQVLSGSSYKDVDTWTLDQQMRAPGDGTAAALWLAGIQHTGKVGGTASLPQVRFAGVQKPNRVDALEGRPPLTKWRISAIDNETGGALSITYSDEDCKAGDTPEPDSNTRRCYPQYWSPEGATAPKRDWFHKYVVTQVQQIDRTGGAPDVLETYEYLGGGAWHHDDDDGLTKEKYKTWSQWRGYGKVRVLRGAPGEQRSKAEFTYFRGMDGDELSGGGKRDVKVTDSEGTAVDDAEPLQGQVREEIRYDGPTGAAMTGTISGYWTRQTAERVRAWGTTTATMVRGDKERTRTALASGGWRHTTTDTDYNADGLPTQVSDVGDNATADDDQCVRTTYARDAARWMVSYAARVETVTKACTATPDRPGDVVSDVRKYYDGKAFGAAPSKGDVTRTEKLGSWNGGPQYVTAGSTTYDVYGRPLVVTDPNDTTTTTSYTPATGLVTAKQETNALGHVTKTEIEPAWGLPSATTDTNGKRAELAYDPLSRLTGVWLPGHAKATYPSAPNMKFGYQIRTDGPTTVSTSTLRDDGTTYTTGYALYDGLLRARQTQQPAPGGGRLVNDTLYDTRGLVYKTNADYYTEGAPGGTLWVPASDDDVPGQNVTVFNGMEWPTAQIFRKRGTEQWRTTTTYGGDRISVDPPAGATPATKIVNAQGETVEVRQYKGDGPTGDYDATKYTYTRAGQPATITDTAGNAWLYHYDLRGRLIQVDDPDKGTAKLTYDDKSDQLKTATDARGSSLFFTYDALGRKTAEYAGTSASGTKLAEWTFDKLADGTVVKGQPTSSTRYVKNATSGALDAYTSAVTGYDNAYRATGTRTVIPAAEGALAGTYKTTTDYNSDGTVHRTVSPAAGGLLGETLLYGYDALGNPTTMRGLTNYVTSTTYSKLGQVLDLTMSTGLKRVKRTNFYEEGTNRLSRSLYERETAPISVADTNYTYDPAGNITKIADTPSGQPSDVQCFQQDYLQRLTEAWTATDGCAAGPAQAIIGGPAPYWQSFDYDSVGNRTKEIDHDPAGDVTKTFGYAGPGKPQPHTLTSVEYKGGTRDGQIDTYTYDKAGNTTERGSGRLLEWDVEGHLAKSTDPSGVSTFLYDANGDRLIRRDPTSTTLYVADMEIRLDVKSGAKTATRYYTYAGQAIATRTNQGVTWLGADHHGSADASIDDTDTQTATRRRFTPFGQQRGTPPPHWPGQRGYVGGIIDEATALTHLGAREYDAETGRFISVDPVFDATDPQSWNGYAYADNRPITGSDPTGLMFDTPPCGWSCSGGSGGGGGGGGIAYPPPPPPSNPPHCGRWSFGCKAKNLWNEHKATIVNVTVAIVVTVGCEVATGGVGSIGCAAAGGAAGNLAGYLVSTPRDEWSAGGAFKTMAVGAVSGAAGGGLGKAAGAALGKLATTATGRAVAGAVGKAAGKAKSALGRGGGAATEGAEAAGGAAARAGGKPRASAGARSGCNSFVAGTKVKLADGTYKAIEKIKPGEKVLATDPATGKTEPKLVVAAFSGVGYLGLVQITVDTDGRKGDATGVILATEHHLFWDTEDRTWVRADQLTSADNLRTPDGKTLDVVTTARQPNHPTVHDLTVADHHTYYVLAGTTPILVHNCHEVAVDTNAISDALTGGRSADVDAALNGRSPVISPTAYNELLEGGHSPTSINEWMSARGGRMGAEGSIHGAQSMQESINEMWKGGFRPVLHDDDALVLHSALEDNLSLITNDKRFAKNIARLGLPVEGY
ncbi:polymorphic toxin-type HINT domain-containing protein [Streptosporangium sp. NBC_01639]|uniref:polymorphic toxin-type HINT domain-containing protein n=1 Tax=Streptosporangium sp. NBC_01639 TaxID=2975948 RepID=UPI0038634EE4|nr:polymorphic toxin-type HINT domain-containing protein [Streptosporangium sp. NBC_01639]